MFAGPFTTLILYNMLKVRLKFCFRAMKIFYRQYTILLIALIVFAQVLNRVGVILKKARKGNF